MFMVWNYYRQEPEWRLGIMTRDRALALVANCQRWGIMFAPYMIGQIEN